jgi:NDP-sugar pyrophosphorylase family protein
MAVREYEFQVPYGVVATEGHRITRIDEKPIHSFFVNAGMYVLSPEALGEIPADAFFDMPTLFARLVEKKKETAVFPIREYWLDIGHLADYQRANGEFSEVFS